MSTGSTSRLPRNPCKRSYTDSVHRFWYKEIVGDGNAYAPGGDEHFWPEFVRAVFVDLYFQKLTTVLTTALFLSITYNDRASHGHLRKALDMKPQTQWTCFCHQNVSKMYEIAYRWLDRDSSLISQLPSKISITNFMLLFQF